MKGGLHNPTPVDDTVVNGNTDHAASSNWAFDHAADLDAHGALAVRKTSDEAVNNSNVLQNDDELLLAIPANQTWVYELGIHCQQGAANANIKFAITVPAGAALIFGFSVQDNVLQTVSGGAFTLALNNGIFRFFTLKAIVVNGVTAGNVQFQWAQGTASAVDTEVKLNSFLIGWRIA